MDNYVADPYPMQNFITIRLPLSPPKYAKNAHEVSRLVLSWLFHRPTAETPAPIFTLNTSNDPKGTSRSGTRMCLWDLENKILYFDPSSKKEIWGQFSTGLRKFRLKNLTMAYLQAT